jgi:outer membrane biogenesis lipoprotein LolB
MKHRLRHIALLLCAVLLVGCSAHGHHGEHESDVLNRAAYAWRYRNLDSASHYAHRAYEAASRYTHGRTVACNMLGFVL